MKALFFAFLLSISSIAEAQQMQIKNGKEDITSMPYQLAVASLKIAKSKDQYSVSLTKWKILAVAKDYFDPCEKWAENDFVCFVLDGDKKNVDTLVIRQPLNPRYEYPNEDETIGQTTIDLNENEVLLRFTYNTNMKYFNISRVGKDGNLGNPDTLLLPHIK